MYDLASTSQHPISDTEQVQALLVTDKSLTHFTKFECWAALRLGKMLPILHQRQQKNS